jgi:type II secretion system (T2SS) protein E
VASITDLLVKIQILDERQHDAVLSRSRSSAGGHVVQQVAEMGYATEGTMARAISVELGLPRVDLAMTPPEPAALALLDARTCSDRFVLPVALRENGELLWLAMADPTDQEFIGVVKRKTGKRVRPAVAGPTEILRAVRTLYTSPAPSNQPEHVDTGKLEAIAIESADDSSTFEVMNAADDIDGSALSRIAKQLGVEKPVTGPQSPRTPSAPPPPPNSDPPAPAFTFEELFTPVTRPGPIGRDDLREDDLSAIEALRTSMEKAALVLRTVAALCVEKHVLSRDDMKKH